MRDASKEDPDTHSTPAFEFLFIYLFIIIIIIIIIINLVDNTKRKFRPIRRFSISF